MTELPARHHPLESFFRTVPATDDGRAEVEIKIRPNLDYINLRGDPADARFATAVAEILQQELPLVANTMRGGPISIFWLGPDEWLIVTRAGHGAALAVSLGDTVSDFHASVNELHGGQIALRLSGPRSVEILAKGCTLDLHARSFAAGDCAQTGLGKANVLIGKVSEDPVFDVIVRRSFAEYLANWLKTAGAEFGVRFSMAE